MIRAVRDMMRPSGAMRFTRMQVGDREKSSRGDDAALWGFFIASCSMWIMHDARADDKERSVRPLVSRIRSSPEFKVPSEAEAFEKAWAFIKADPVLIEAGLQVAPTELASALMTALEQDSNPRRLANRAITPRGSASRSAARMMQVLAPDAAANSRSVSSRA